MRRWIEILLLIGLSLGTGFLLFAYPPTPPAGVCDAGGTPEECSEWWHDIMERP